MQKELFELSNKWAQSLIDATRKLGELNLKTLDKVVETQGALAGAYFNASSRALELAGKAKGYQELVGGQAEVVREYGETLMAALRKGAELAVDARAEYGALVEQNLKTAQAQLDEVARVVTAKAA